MPSPSVWPKEEGRIDKTDKLLTYHVYKLKFNLATEILLSLPGCFFGMPIALILFGTYFLENTHTHISAHSTLNFAATGIILLLWARVLSGHKQPRQLSALLALKLLYNPKLVLIAPLIVNLAAFSTQAKANAANFYFMTWFTTITVVLLLKRATLRRRPVACEAELFGKKSHPPKNLSAMRRMLLNDVNGAFPSGDVAGAVNFAYVVTHCQGRFEIAVLCIFLSALGRMYWGAHHLLDVICGLLLSWFVNWVVGSALWHVEGGMCGTASVYHLFVSQLFLMFIVWGQGLGVGKISKS